MLGIDCLISLDILVAVLLDGFFAGGQPEAFAVHLEDVNMMGEPVEQSAGEAFGTKDRGPFIKGQIAGDQGGTALVTLTEHFKQELRAHSGEGHITEFVDDQELHGVEMFL